MWFGNCQWDRSNIAETMELFEPKLSSSYSPTRNTTERRPKHRSRSLQRSSQEYLNYNSYTYCDVATPKRQRNHRKTGLQNPPPPHSMRALMSMSNRRINEANSRNSHHFYENWDAEER